MRKLIDGVEKNEETIRSFNDVKSRFLDEFEKETVEIAVKWREIEIKKQE